MSRKLVAGDATAAGLIPLERGEDGGRRSRVVAIALTAVVLSFLYLTLVTTVRSAERRLGFLSATTPEGLEIVRIGAGSAAERAGVREGDLLLSVAGLATPDDAAYDSAARRLHRNVTAPFVVRRGGEVHTLGVLPGVPVAWVPLGARLLSALAYLALALAVLMQGRQDLRTRLLFAFSAAVAVELSLPDYAIGAAGLSLLTVPAFYLLTGVEIGLELHLASVLPERQAWIARRPWVIPAIYAIGVTFGLIQCGLYLVERFGSRDTEALRNILLDISLPIWGAAVVALLASQMLRHPEPLGRQRAALVLLGTVPWATFAWVIGIMWVVGSELPSWPEILEPLILFCFPVAVFVAIFRYQLFDIGLIVRRGLVYGTMTGALVLLFYAAVGAGSALLAQFFIGGAPSIWVASGATLVLGLLFSPLRERLQTAIDRSVFPERHALRQRLVSLAAELPAQGKLPLMGKHLVAELARIFGLRSATLLVADPTSGLLLTLASTRTDQERELELSFLLSPDDEGLQLIRRAHRALPAAQLIARSPSLAHRLASFAVDVIAPVMSHGKVIGLLLLGGKREGGRFAAEEIDLLNLLSHHVATVLENARLFESATHDSLTGLLRREAVLEVLERELQRALRYRRPLTIGMADLDHFKETNDRYGHLVGDTVLNRVAQALAAGLRGTDAIGRYGGEEFLVVLPETDLAGALTVAEKVRGIVEGVRLSIGGGEVTVSVSIGLASLDLDAPSAPSTHIDLIGAADRCLYKAKSSGRNRIEPATAG